MVMKISAFNLNNNFLFSLQRSMLFLFAAIIPWQFYFKFYGSIDLPLSFFILCAGFAISIFSGVDWKTAFHKLKWIVSGYSLMFASIAVSSLINSPDNLYTAANVLGHLSTGLIVILWIGLIFNARKKPAIHIDKIVRVFLLSAFPLGVIGVIFLILPQLEERWLNMIAGILIEADSATSRNNILGINRVGVIFMDVNTAVVFWGMSMWLALWIQQKSCGFKRLAYLVLAIIFFLDFIATGSRSGILTLILTLIIAYAIHVAHYKKTGKKTKNRAVFITIIVIAVLSISIIGLSTSKHNIFNNTIERTKRLASQDLGESDSKRLQLLKCSITAIKKKPLFGHGIVDFADLKFPDGFPPHNMFLMTWIYGGLPALLGLIWLFTTVLYRLFRQLKNDYDMRIPIVLISGLIIQSMFTNLIILNFRIAMFLWLAIIPFLLSSRTEHLKCTDN